MTRFLPLILLPLLAGCSTITVDQGNKVVTQYADRTVTEDIKLKSTATSWFSARVNAEKFKALITDKTMSVGSGTFGQQGATNGVAMIQALTELAKEVNPKP